MVIEMKNILKEILSTSIYLLIVLLITYLIVNFVGQRTEVVGSSMESTLSDGDNLIVDKITYRFSNPERYDIIVFPFQYEKNTYYIKRIIGLPGETVQIVGQTILINGEPLEEAYGSTEMKIAGVAEQPLKLGKDEYFVLGDNREVSLDSRRNGPVPLSRIEGKLLLRIFPLKRFGTVN